MTPSSTQTQRQVARHRLSCLESARVFLFSMVLCACAGSAQYLPTQILTVDDGLPSPGILDLAQDSTGRLWILTRVGVSSFDGQELTGYTTADGLTPNRPGALTIDSSERIWVVSGRNPTVFYLTEDRWQPLPQSGETPLSEAASFLEVLIEQDRAMVVMARGDKGIWIWREQADGTFSMPERVESRELGVTVTASAVIDGRIALGTDDGLCFLDYAGLVDCRAKQHEPKLASPIHSLIAEPIPGSPTRLWILAEDPRADKVRASGIAPPWLGYLQHRQVTMVAEAPTLPLSILRPRQIDQFKTIMAIDPVGGLYIGNPGALFYLDADRRKTTHLGLSEGLPATGAYSLLVDRESNIWVGGSRGLCRIAGRRFLSFNQRQGLLEDEVAAIIEPSPGRYILGHNLGLSFLDGDRVTTLPFDRAPEQARNDYRTLDLELDARGDLWITTPNVGLLRVDGDLRVTHELPEMAIARSLAKDPQGRLWVMGVEGLFVQTADGFELRHRPDGLGGARWLAISARERFFVTTQQGLLTWSKDDDWQHVHAPKPDGDSLFGLLIRQSGEVWVGSNAGPYIFRDGRLHPIGNGFPELRAPVFSIFEDRHDRVWLGTDDGVRIWDGADLQHLTVRHGLSGRETNRGAGFVDHQGRVWIGTDRGVSVYQEAYDSTVPSPVLELVGVDLDGTTLPLDQDLSLEHWQNALTFKFRAIAFSTEEQLQLRYQLEGFDEREKGPTTIPASEIRYTNLAPGTYRFRIRAGWENGRWSDEAISGVIRIPRPFWRTRAFLTALLVVMGSSIWGAYQLRTRRIRARAAELESMNRKLRDAAQEREQLIESLEAQNVELERFTYTVSHDLKSPLVTIRGFLGFLRQARATGDYDQMDQDIDRIDDAAEKMGRLLEELLELARVGQVLNPPEWISLSELMQESIELSAAAIRQRRAEVKVGPDLPEVFGDRLRLRLVFQNLIDNALKFAREDTTPRIVIRAGNRADHTRITVTDNGIGIDPAHQQQIFGLFKRLTPAVPGTGVGLALVQRIVKAHGGEIQVESEGLGHGSRFVVVLPRTARDGTSTVP